MHCTFADPVTPIRRFEAIFAAVPQANAALMLGILAGVPASGTPSQIANAITGYARQLAHPGSIPLPEAVRFQIAAVLSYADIPVERFLAFLSMASAPFSADRTDADPVSESLAIAALLATTESGMISDRDFSRIIGLRRLMRERHWWTGVPADLPTAAMLNGLHERPRDLEGRIESHYLELVGKGFAGGTPLHIAAAILALAPDGYTHAYPQFLGLAQAMHLPLRQIHPPALALLALLPQTPERICDQHQAIDAHLRTHLPATDHGSALMLSAGITYLDLATFSADGRALPASPDSPAHDRMTRILEAALCCLATHAAMPEPADIPYVI